MLNYTSLLVMNASKPVGPLGQAAFPLRPERRSHQAALLVDYQTRCRLSLGEMYLHAGRLDEAHTQAQRTLDLAWTHRERGHEAYALRLLGDIAAQQSPPEAEQAEACYHQALALSEELGMRPLQAHCHRGLSILYMQRGHRGQAHAALSTAIDLYRAIEMTFWLPQAEVALAQVRADVRG